LAAAYGVLTAIVVYGIPFLLQFVKLPAVRRDATAFESDKDISTPVAAAGSDDARRTLFGGKFCCDREKTVHLMERIEFRSAGIDARSG
jgi:hypothetical protein